MGKIFTIEQISQDYLRGLREERPELADDPAFYPAKLAEEAGEAVKEGNKRLGYSRHEYDPDLEAEELADVLICAWSQAISAGIDIQSALQRKHAKLMNRSWAQEQEASNAKSG
jgi:NTP pyrophosphatase (non-canonical NTP hydrolase)